MLLRNGRTQLYTIDQLINAANLAYTSGHENICEQIIENLTVSQKIVVQERLETVRSKRELSMDIATTIGLVDVVYI